MDGWLSTDASVLVGELEPELVRAIFGPQVPVRAPGDAGMVDVLVRAGAFPSRGQARKNWRGPLEVPIGSSTVRVGRRVIFLHRANVAC